MAKNKIKKEELKDLQTKVVNINNLQYKLGALEIEKNKVLQSYDVAKTELKTLQLALKEVYGGVSIDVNDGSIKKIEEVDEQTNKKN
tara:strand:- start:29 stop:289 length:261 start_codon:yes stop_codon:yes gene_type:complete